MKQTHTRLVGYSADGQIMDIIDVPIRGARFSVRRAKKHMQSFSHNAHVRRVKRFEPGVK